MIYEQFVTFTEQRGDQLYAHCPFHVDDTESFTVNPETGEWFCHSCKRGGAEVEFISALYDVGKNVSRHALNYFTAKGVWPFPTEEYIKARQQELRNNKLELDALYNFGITDEVIEKYQLGLEGLRITIPVYSRTGYCINIRKYLPPHHRTHDGTNNAKCINIRNLGEKRYYPFSAFTNNTDDIYIVEGEKDCLVAISQGYNAVTSTGGSSIPTEELVMFKNKNVFVMLDTDAPGQKNTKLYCQLLRGIAKNIYVVTLPDGCKDYTEYWQQYHIADVSAFTQAYQEETAERVDALEMSLVKSENVENLNTWLMLRNMSVVGTEPKVYSVPSKLRVVCNNTKCNKNCPLSLGMGTPELTEINVEPRQIIQFVDSPDTAQDNFLRKMFGCKSVVAEALEVTNVQKFIFQETASFVEGLEDSSSDTRYGMYMYTDYRLQPTAKYNFEACRVTDPRNQKNYYVIRNAENVHATLPVLGDGTFEKFRKAAEGCATPFELMQKYYNEWLACLSIEGRLDLFGSILLAYASVTEIPWNFGVIKGWLDMIVMGDTRTGKSQMAQRMVRELGMGGYINGENSRVTGVIGGVQKIADSWMITWGAIPMNDKGLLFIDEASGLSVDDIKDLSSTRSSGAVTLNKIVKGEARARTRLVWLSNPRSGRNVAEFYWKGFGAFQEYIPVVEDQARYDLVLTAAREDIDVLDGIEATSMPQTELWRALFSVAWNLTSDQIKFSKDFKQAMRDTAHKLNDDYGGGPLVVGVAVHEKLLRLSCAMAVLCGDVYDGNLQVTTKHLDWAQQWLRYTLEKPSLSYGAYVREKRRAEQKKQENINWIKAQLELHPALKSLLTASSFKGYQITEILGIDRTDASKLLSELLGRGLVKTGRSSSYIPDKLLLDVARQEEVIFDE